MAITRARKRLFISAAGTRRRKGKVLEASPSPFIDELTGELLEFHREEEAVTPEDAALLFENIKRKFA